MRSGKRMNVSGYRWRRAVGGWVLCFALLASCSGLKDCIENPNPLTPVGSAIDDAIAALQKESQNWRKTLEETRDRLIREGQSALANEVSNLLDRAVNAAATNVRCVIDMIPQRLEQALRRIAAEIKKQPIPPIQPALCDTVPASVDVTLVPQRLQILEAFGYDLDVGSFTATVTNGGPPTDATKYLDYPTHYKMTVNLSRMRADGILQSGMHGHINLLWTGKVLYSIAIASSPVAPSCVDIGYVGDTDHEGPQGLCSDESGATGLDCQGNYCNRMSLHCCGPMSFANRTTNDKWSEWIGVFIPFYQPMIPPDTALPPPALPPPAPEPPTIVTGIQGRGNDCSQIRVRFSRPEGFKIDPASCFWSVGGYGLKTCPEGYWVSGVKCEGARCESIPLRCCRFVPK